MSRSVTVVMRNLPLDFTNEEVAAALWATVGINVDPQQIRTTSGTYSKQAFIPLTDDNLVEFLTRNFKDTAVLREQQVVPYFETVQNPRLRVSSAQKKREFAASFYSEQGLVHAAP